MTIKRWNSLPSIDDVATKIEDLVIHHPRFQLALERIEWCRRQERRGGTPRGLLVVGASGSGKSTLKECVVSGVQWTTVKGNRIVPIVTASVPSVPTIKSLAHVALSAIGDHLWDKGSAPQLTHRVITLLTACHTELVLFDEVQHFSDTRRYVGLSRAADWLKEVMDQTSIPTVLLGLPRAEEVLFANEQLRRRFSAKIELRAFDISDDIDFMSFRRVLKQLEDEMLFPEASNLGESPLAQQIYFATNGLIGYMKQIIIGAAKVALEERANAINALHLEAAFYREIWAEGMNSLNPFHRHFERRRLDRPGEPFAPGGIS